EYILVNLCVEPFSLETFKVRQSQDYSVVSTDLSCCQRQARNTGRSTDPTTAYSFGGLRRRSLSSIMQRPTHSCFVDGRRLSVVPQREHRRQGLVICWTFMEVALARFGHRRT
ncbi:hypothetical protein AAVH_19757, partial [Aphelenchoides avenae]